MKIYCSSSWGGTVLSISIPYGKQTSILIAKLACLYVVTIVRLIIVQEIYEFQNKSLIWVFLIGVLTPISNPSILHNIDLNWYSRPGLQPVPKECRTMLCMNFLVQISMSQILWETISDWKHKYCIYICLLYILTDEGSCCILSPLGFLNYID